MFGKPRLRSLGPAEAALSTYRKIEQAIEQGVKDLEPLIQRRQEAERSLRDAEIAAATGEGAELPKAQKAVEAALKAIDAQASRLRGLRGRLSARAPELIAAHGALKAELPSYAEAVKEEFAREWEKAVQAFSVALSRRAAIEKLIGESLPLPAPAAGPCDLGDLGKPHAVLGDLRAGIESIASMGRAWPVVAPVPGTPITPFDPQGIYILRHPASGLPEGTLVVDCSFPEGQLAHLVSAGWAVPAVDPEVQQGLWAARQAARVLKQEEEEAERRWRDEELKQAAGLQLDVLGRPAPKYARRLSSSEIRRLEKEYEEEQAKCLKEREQERRQAEARRNQAISVPPAVGPAEEVRRGREEAERYGYAGKRGSL
jgi:hypothetical protein